MDENLGYIYDGCYYLNRSFNSDNEDTNLDDFLKTNFEEITQNNFNIEHCKNKALEERKDFFLFSNFKKDTTNTEDTGNSNLSYTCYIPKEEANCDFSNIADLVDPFNNTLKNLLGNTVEVREKVDNTDLMNISSGTYRDIIGSNNENLPKFNNAKCYKYTDNNNNEDLYFGRIREDTQYSNTTFALYKTDIILNDDIYSILNNPKIKNMHISYDDYESYYNTEFKESKINEKIDNLESYFRNYLDNPGNSQYEKLLDDSLIELYDYYQGLFTKLDELSTDISNVSIIIKYDLYRLNHLEKEIKTQKKKLNNYLGFDGAGNGKLFDTKYLKNVKLSETIILSLIIIFLIFFYAKKK